MNLSFYYIVAYLCRTLNKNFQTQPSKIMKKIVVIILMAFSLGLIMSSCQSSQKCAAYGETGKYKVDRNR